MREFPRGGLIGKTVYLWQRISALRIPLYAANSCFFWLLSAFPALLLLLGLLRCTSLEVERLGELLEGLLPGVLLPEAEELILTTYDRTTGATLGISALTVLWSASRGVYGVITGLNGIYGLRETRGWLKTRLLSVGYTFLLLLAVLATLTVHVFGTRLLAVLAAAPVRFLRFLGYVLNFRLGLLLSLQTGIFCAMFLALPNRRSTLRRELPGAVLAALGWQIFSWLYSVYVTHFGSRSFLYTGTLGMLWLYCCLCIVFYGGGLNALLRRRRSGWQ